MPCKRRAELLFGKEDSLRYQQRGDSFATWVKHLAVLAHQSPENGLAHPPPGTIHHARLVHAP
jgi:hypothetical protein